MPEVTLKSWIMVLTLGCVWGASFLGIEVALRGITPFWLAEARLFFAAMLLTGVWWALGGRINAADDGRNRWPYLVVVGLFSSLVPFFLLSWGQTHVTSATAGVSMAGVPLLVMPLAHFFSVGERVTPLKLLGLLVGFCGVLVLLGDGLLQSSGSSMEGWGRLACLSAAGCYAISSVTTRNCPTIDPFAMAAVVMIIAACVGLPIAWAFEGPPRLARCADLCGADCLGVGANCRRKPAAHSGDPERRIDVYVPNQLSGAVLVDGVRRLGAGRGAACGVVFGFGTDPGRDGAEPVEPFEAVVRQIINGAWFGPARRFEYSYKDERSGAAGDFDFRDDGVDDFFQEDRVFAFSHDADQRLGA